MDQARQTDVPLSGSRPWESSHPHFPLVFGLLAIVGFQFALGLYASALNRLFYASFGPFYDSLSYTNGLALLQEQIREKGVVRGVFKLAMASTVVLPWLLFAPFARHAQSLRTNGVWIQIAAAVWMHSAVYFYFLRTRGMTILPAFVYSAMFSLIAAGFHFNGGFSDFRMDLFQYLLFSATAAIYLIARSAAGVAAWAVLGLAIGLCCLGRATSPVYIAVLFPILFVADIVADRSNWQRLTLRWSIAGGVACAIALWYFLVNFKHLHYYYFVWGTDTIASLPFALSQLHALFVLDHLGLPLLSGLIFVCVMTILAAARGRGLDVMRDLHWRALLFSIVPVGFLVTKGAGLNPFVSIVGCTGVIIFLLDPIDGARPKLSSRTWFFLLAVLVIGGFANAAAGVRNHSSEKVISSGVPRQSGLRAVIAAMVETAAQQGVRKNFTYAVAQNGWLSAPVIFNSLVYDHGFRVLSVEEVTRDGLSLTSAGDMSKATLVQWSKIPGQTDQDKIRGIIGEVSNNVDFLVVATEDSQLTEHVYGNRFVPEMRRQLLASGNWIQIAEAITISPIEKVIVLKNQLRRDGT